MPEGWEWKKLGDIIELKYGDGLKGDNRESSGKIPVYGSNGIVGYHNKPLTTKSCLIIGRKGSIGEVHLSEVPCWPIDTTYFVEPTPKVNLKFLFYLLKTLKLNSLDRSTAIPGLNRNDVYSKRIPLPPSPIQRQIVAVLEQAEAVKRQRQEADALTGVLLQSVFLEMFGDPVRNERGWEKKELKEFGEIKTGNTPPRINPGNYGDFIEWIKSDNINLRSMYLERSQEFLSEEGLKIGRLAPIESILITCIAGSISCIGNAAIADRDVAFNQQINAIIPRSDVNELFLYYVILLSREYIQNHATKSMTKMINKGILSELLFIAPPFTLQQQFAHVVQEVEALREKQRVSGEEIGGLFDGLMQRAFRGEIVEDEA